MTASYPDMTRGNRLLSSLISLRPARFLFAIAARLLGPAICLDLMAICSLRGRVSVARRELERRYVGRYLPNGASLIIGLKSYNFHYACFYSLWGKTVIVEPFTRMKSPAGITLLPEKIQNCAADIHDLTLVNFVGVYGWGLDTQDELSLTASIILDNLLPGGQLIFAFNLDRDPLGMARNGRVEALFAGLSFSTPETLSGGLQVHIGTKPGSA